MSGAGPVFFATRVKIVVVPGFVALLTTAEPSGPAPMPRPVAAPVWARSTEAEAIAVSWSTPVAVLLLSNTEVAFFVIVTAPTLLALGGRVACRTTL